MKRFTNQSNGSQAGRINNGGAIIRRFALFPLMLLMLLLLPAGMVAQKAASSSKYIATYESSTQTLTFKENVGETLPSNSVVVEDKMKVADIKRNFENGTIVHIVFDKSFSSYTPTSLYNFFAYLTKLETITGLEYLNTEKVTDMSYMFSGCSSLTSLDVTHFNTENVTNMSFMFSNCSALTSLDVTKFNTANVTDMSNMFLGCSKLTSLDVTNFNTEKVTVMNGMFSSCPKLTSLDVTKFNTGNVTNMNCMFYNCSALTSLDVTKFNTGNVTDMSCMFLGCSKLTSLDVTKFNTANVTDMNRMFYNCSALTSLDVTKFNTGNVTDMSSMFSGCSKLTSLDVTKFNTENVTNMMKMFSGCSKLTSLDVTNFNTENVKNMGYMFANCSKLTSLDVTKFNTMNVLNMGFMFMNCESLTSLDVRNFNTVKVTNMSYMFCYCVALTSLYLTNFNTEEVTLMNSMFANCKALTTIYASSKFVTTQVSNSSTMFYNCEKLKGEVVGWTSDNATDKTYAKIEGGYFSGGIPRVKYADGTLTFFLTSKETLGENEYGIYGLGAKPDWVWKNPNVTKVTKVVFDPAFANARPTNCYAWFNGCENLTNIEGIEYLNTSQVTDMHNMFYNCYHLQTTDFSGFDTRKVKDMSYMFHNCGSLKSLDISNFNTSEVTNMRSMFYHCIGLTTLDLSHLNTSKVSIMISMFELCLNLLSVNLSGWDTRNVGSMYHMFEKCKSLKTLDLSGFDTREKTCAMGDMFNTCNELTTIFVSDKFAVGTGDTGDGTMFQGCNKLKGVNALDKDNPQTGIDNANYKTGYFTKLVGKNGDEKIGATGETLATDNLVLDDNKDFVVYEPFAAKAASYSRTVEGTTWATLCLPFEVSLDGQNFRAFKLLSADDVAETVELEEIKTSIAAGTPVIIKMKNGATKLDFTVANMEIANEVKTAETANGNYQLQGLYTQKMFSKDTDNNCYIVKGDKLMNPAKLLDKTTTEHVGSKPFRAYMVDNSSAPAAGARMFSISVGGSTTAIEQLETTADSKAEYYDLQGRRLQDLQKGINIVKRGGKTMKVIIK